MPDLPSWSDFTTGSSPDEVSAAEHFCGKTIAEAYQLIKSNPTQALDDFLWIDSVAFRYYFPAIVRYFHAEDLRQEEYLYAYLASLVRFRIQISSDDIRPYAKDIRFILDNMIQHMQSHTELLAAKGNQDTYAEICATRTLLAPLST